MSKFSEDTPLFAVIKKSSISKSLKVSCCVKSKTARLILVWNFSVFLVTGLLRVSNEFRNQDFYHASLIVPIAIGIVAVLAPTAGLLTDLKYSRYKTVYCSSSFLLFGITTFLCVAAGLSVYAASRGLNFEYIYTKRAFQVGVIVLIGVMIVPSWIFIVNIVRFGVDQLHDSPTEDSILYIHWYVWAYYVSSFITSLPWSLLHFKSYYEKDEQLFIPGVVFVMLVLCAVFLLLTFSLCVTKLKEREFTIEPSGFNPYKLVYGATKFACQHKVPLRRSAFTYCEDELPSRMDLGKQKYGGPFTTKEVEDVKAFWGILKVLSTIGLVYMLQFAAQSVLPLFAKHNTIYQLNFTKESVSADKIARYIFVNNNFLSPLVVVICIPLYMCFIRPHFTNLIPGMLRRIGLGIGLLILSLMVSLAMDVAVHRVEMDAQCMFRGFTHGGQCYNVQENISATHSLYQNMLFLTSQHLLSAVTNIILDIAVLEFILSQSPYSMKGLLLGYFFSMTSFSQAMAIACIFCFGRFWNFKLLSCGSGFYILNIVLGVLDLLLFAVVAKRYNYRTVNEPSNEYRYAEEYYSNIP